jgi:aryl-alcohol dehydrogenase (NADP+)
MSASEAFGREVFPLALGTNTFGWTAGPEASQQILDGFVAGGGNFIDTADVYSVWAPGSKGGDAETVIGDWLASRKNRESVLLATKVSAHPDFKGLKATTIAGAVEQSLRRLQTDYIDVYYAHYDDPDTPLEETVAAFADLVQRGTIRHVGLSNYTADRVQAWVDAATSLGVAKPVSLQPEYNLVSREFETSLQPVAERNGLAVLPYFGLAAGFLTGKYETAADVEGTARAKMLGEFVNDKAFAVVHELKAVASELDVQPATVALAWLRSRSTVVAPISSASTPEQLEPLLASATLDLSTEQLQRLTSVSDALLA